MPSTGTTGYGVLDSGFYPKPLSVIDDEVDAALQAILGTTAGVDEEGKIPTESIAGQLKALIVDGLAGAWDLSKAVYDSFDPAKARGQALDAICALTGTQRQPERLSVATGIAVGNPNTSLPAGRAATPLGVANRFSTPSHYTVATGDAFSNGGAYSIGDLFYTPASRTYLCVDPGTASASGPSGTGSSITDGSCVFRYLGDGIGNVAMAMISETRGPVGVATGALNQIATPVDGWAAIYNPQAANVGRFEEGNAALRLRREEDLASAGNTTVDAIRSNVLSVNEGSTDPAHEPVTACTVFFNDTDYTDANGVPPHAIEALVQDGTTADIAQAIWDSLGAGTATYGNVTSSAVDSEGNTQVVKFSRPTEVPIYVTAAGKYLATEWPAGSDSVVAQYMLSAFLTEVADWPPGRDVRQSPLNAAIMRGAAGVTGGLAIVPAPDGADQIPGLLEVETLNFGTTVSPSTSTQVTIGTREIAVFDSSRCVFTATTEGS